MSTDQEVDLVDRIAQDLPAEVRAAYYRELNHCRSLPENDEMLRILRAMQFLTLLMRRVPEEVSAERARLEVVLGEAVGEMKGFSQRAGEFRAAIETRLVELPSAVADGLRPDLIAREINESLRQQFVASTIPQTAHAMTVAAEEMKIAVAGFTRTAAALHDEHRSAAAQAKKAIQHLQDALSRSAEAAQSAAQQLSGGFHRELRWSIYTLVSFTALLAFSAGALFELWVSTPATVSSQPAPASVSIPQKSHAKSPR